jgi:predicted DNA-binding transcriptional regulator AlpA
MGARINPRKYLEGAPRAVRWPSPRVEDWLRDRIKAAGGDPAEVPTAPFRFLPLSAVMEMTGLKNSSIYRMMKNGKFPKAVPVDISSVSASVDHA